MLNWWLILLIILIPLLCIGLTIYVIFYFQSPEDDISTLPSKIVFGVGLVLAMGSVLLVPYDIANSPDPTVVNKYNQTLNTTLMWEIVLWMMAAMAVIICPFFMFFYEAYDPDKPRIGKQVAHGIISVIVILAIFGLITGLCYNFVGVALIPFQGYATTPQLMDPDSWESLTYNGTYSQEVLEIPVTFTTYTMGMLCFFGWIGFVIYGGFGILGYPIKTLLAFSKRTKAISASRFAQEMAIVLAKADAMLDLSLKVQKETRGAMTRAVKNKINIIRNEVYFLEAHEENLIWAFTKAGGSPFIVYGKVVIAVLCLATAILWMLHIFIYNTFDANPFLNTMLIDLGNAFPLFGIIAYGIMSFYLQWATFQGQIMLGLRFIFFQIHPMKKHDTLVNALIFNASLLLFTSFAVIEFVVRSFQDYAPYSAINGLMNVFVLHLKGIGYFIQWAQFGVLVVGLLSVIVTLLFCKKKRRDPLKLRLDDIR